MRRLGAAGVRFLLAKLMVYTAAAGVDPSRIMPVVIDTEYQSNKNCSDDPTVPGRRRHKARRRGTATTPSLTTLATVEEALPNLYLHFGLRPLSHATAILDRYRTPTLSSATTSGVLVLLPLQASSVGLNISGEKLVEARYTSALVQEPLVCGIAERVLQEFVDQEWIAKRLIALLPGDRQGLFKRHGQPHSTAEAICSRAFWDL